MADKTLPRRCRRKLEDIFIGYDANHQYDRRMDKIAVAYNALRYSAVQKKNRTKMAAIRSTYAAVAI